MKRSGFTRKAAGPRHIAEVLEVAVRELPRPTRWLAGAPVAPTFVQAPKHEYVRSETLRLAYRALPCQHCGDDGPDAGVCCAHANWSVFGKGKGIKADDDRGASLCWVCHRELDQGSAWSGDEKRRIWATAHIKTVAELLACGWWPKAIAVPDMTIVAEWLA